jgi:hypothetical protein
MPGNAGSTYQLDGSNDLQSWMTLANCHGPGPDVAIEVCDPEAGQTQPFYRLSAP